jgi:hypothetical protein
MKPAQAGLVCVAAVSTAQLLDNLVGYGGFIIERFIA